MKSSKDLTLLYAVTQFAYWMGFAAISAFASMYLLGFNASNSMIGTMIAISNIAASIMQPILGSLSDRNAKFSVRRFLLLFALLIIVMAAFLLTIKGIAVGAICVLYGVCIIGLSIAQPFVNALGMRCINAGYSLNFGTSRAFGSVGYAICAYLLGHLCDRFGVNMIPLLFSIAFLIVLFSVLLYPNLDVISKTTYNSETEIASPDSAQKTNSKSEKEKGFFSRYPYFTIMLIGLVCVYFGHSLINTYTLQIVQTKGGSSAQMGNATALAASVELLVMFLFSWIMKKVPLKQLLRISGIFFTLKVLSSLLVTNMTGFYLIQLMQFFGWGIMAVGLVYYVNQIMAPEDCTRGQAYATMTYNISWVAGSLVGGALLDLAGVPAMLICGTIVCGIGAVIIFIGTSK